MSVIQFFQEHQVVAVGLCIALLDFLFALNPKWESNGILHALYVLVKGKPQ
jgi:hypothetical protein